MKKYDEVKNSIAIVLLILLLLFMFSCKASDTIPPGSSEILPDNVNAVDSIQEEPVMSCNSSLISIPLYQVRTLVELHVRSGPGTDYSVLYNLPYGSIKDVYEIKSDGTYQWNRVSENEWIANDGTWLEKVEGQSPSGNIPGNKYPRILNQDEVLAFEHTFTGSWHSFNPPQDEYSMNLIMLVISLDDSFPEETIFPWSPAGNIMLGGPWLAYPSYRITEIIQRSDTSWDIELKQIIYDYYAGNFIDSISVSIVDQDNIKVVLSKGDIDHPCLEFGKEYLFTRITKGYDVTETRYWQWVKDNGYKSNYVL